MTGNIRVIIKKIIFCDSSAEGFGVMRIDCHMLKPIRMGSKLTGKLPTRKSVSGREVRDPQERVQAQFDRGLEGGVETEENRHLDQNRQATSEGVNLMLLVELH